MSKPGVEKRRPWLLNLRAARERCMNKNGPGYKYYGARGISCLLTRDEAEILWFRDKASEMMCPTIDRIDPKTDYTFKNCRFLERSENARRARIGRRKKC